MNTENPVQVGLIKKIRLYIVSSFQTKAGWTFQKETVFSHL